MWDGERWTAICFYSERAPQTLTSRLLVLCSVLIFVLPHQFLNRICPSIREVMAPTAKCMSLIKGIEFENNQPKLISDMISAHMDGKHVSVLSACHLAACALNSPPFPTSSRD